MLNRPVTRDDIRKLNDATDVTVAQKTPMRVLHRRTLMVRDRTVHRMRAARLASRFMLLDLTTQASRHRV